jgi:hypothetical protein
MEDQRFQPPNHKSVHEGIRQNKCSFVRADFDGWMDGLLFVHTERVGILGGNHLSRTGPSSDASNRGTISQDSTIDTNVDNTLKR